MRNNNRKPKLATSTNHNIIQSPVISSSTRNSENRKAKQWIFSFKYWQQREYFGLSDSDTKWFVSFLERLADLSKLSIDAIISDKSSKQGLRLHKINWNQKNIPIKREDFNLIDTDYKNDDEYPILQFQVSKSFGRVVGFFDENSVFNILLLDPLHNLQPSKDYKYKVNPCFPLPCDYSHLIHRLNTISKNQKCGEGCLTLKELESLQSENVSSNVIFCALDDHTIKLLYKTLDTYDCSVNDLLEAGVNLMQGPQYHHN